MGKALAIVGLVLLILVGSCAGCLFLAWKKATGLQDDFYATVNSGDVAKVKSAFSESTRKTIDDAQLAAWVKAVNENLGTYQEMGVNGMHIDMNTTPAGEAVRSEGILEFEKGKVTSVLRLIDEKVVGLEVTSEVPGVSIRIGDPGQRKKDGSGAGDGSGGGAGDGSGGGSGSGAGDGSGSGSGQGDGTK